MELLGTVTGVSPQVMFVFPYLKGKAEYFEGKLFMEECKLFKLFMVSNGNGISVDNSSCLHSCVNAQRSCNHFRRENDKSRPGPPLGRDSYVLEAVISARSANDKHQLVVGNKSNQQCGKTMKISDHQCFPEKLSDCLHHGWDKMKRPHNAGSSNLTL